MFIYQAQALSVTRRKSIAQASSAILTASGINPQACSAEGLASKLSLRDPALLKNSVFNIPPAAQTYPEFMRGDWDVEMRYRGFVFPSKTIPKDKLVANVGIPGFQKLSIAQIGDVGKESANYRLMIDESTGLEDRKLSLSSSIDSHLGYEAVREVVYDVKDNPNRLSVDFIPQRTRNANRIELFYNGRDAELVASTESASGKTVFVCSEFTRQVTFGLSQEFGVARQAVTNYGHFWTWKSGGRPDELTGNLLTAAYLDPQDPMFFDEPSKPVVVYSHDLVAKRRR